MYVLKKSADICPRARPLTEQKLTLLPGRSQ